MTPAEPDWDLGDWGGRVTEFPGSGRIEGVGPILFSRGGGMVSIWVSDVCWKGGLWGAMGMPAIVSSWDRFGWIY